MKKLNAFQIKVFLIIMMLLDHISSAFPGVLPNWTHAITRGVSPMFAYFLVEGYFYTRSKKKYGIRLLSFAVLMYLGNTLINTLLAVKGVYVENNIFETLFAGFIGIWIFDYAKKKQGSVKVLLIILGVVCSIIGALFTEGGLSVIPFILITYFFRENTKKQIVGYLLLSIVLFFMVFTPYETVAETIDMLMFNSDFLLILAIPTILLYNGERGLNNKFSKYLFYVFYPLHLWGLAIISYLIK
ncbi:conjugal transfer protein TraX [Clostridium botulinum]|uniref:TraX family protein n=1 Tax=Clostridium sp. ZBS18 TaxID=2949967 RepID=UPI0002E22B43|nr:TraX family protein [Clostridium sp. ZBS18]MBN1055502.1 conjugal transfer protein TraX [Clostridium botulinum]